MARYARGDFAGAVRVAQDVLHGVPDPLPDEARWRVAAVGAAAVRMSARTVGTDFASVSRQSLEAVKKAWGADAERYFDRKDLQRIAAEAALDSKPTDSKTGDYP